LNVDGFVVEGTFCFIQKKVPQNTPVNSSLSRAAIAGDL
jgi:hypothetical protein